MNTIRQLCDRCIVLEKGRIIYDGEIEKAIQVYLGNKNSKSVLNDLFSIPRESIGDGKMRMKTLELLRDNNIISNGDQLDIRLVYQSTIDCNNLAFRMILFSELQHPVGMAASNACIPAKIGENEVLLSVMLPNIAEGAYSCRIVLYEVDEFGNELIHDVVHDAVTIEKVIICKENDTAKRWNSRVWGNIVFPTIRVK